MKNIILAIGVFFFGTNVCAQESSENISAVFAASPDYLLIGTDAAQKAELAAHPDSAEVSVINALNDEIVRTALSDRYIALKTSDAGTLEIMMLPLVNDTFMLGVLRTVCGKVCDSRIDFYTTDWKPVEQDGLFPTVDKSMFLRSDVDAASEDYLNAVAFLDMTPVKLSYSDDRREITAEYDIEGYLSADDYKLLEPFLVKEPKIFGWDNFSFKQKVSDKES